MIGFYLCGLVAIMECVLASARQFEEENELHFLYRRLGFFLYLGSILWATIGIYYMLHPIHFGIILLLDLAFPVFKAYTHYTENTTQFIIRKSVIFIVTLCVIVEGFYQYSL